VFICYIDESGTSAIPGNTSHFVLAGLSIPIWHWKDCDQQIAKIKSIYQLEDAEIHTAWLARKYLEQSKIPDFENLNYQQRRSQVSQLRKSELYSLQKTNNPSLKQTKKNYEKTDVYIHLTLSERHQLLLDLARAVGNWGFARLFAECVDKIHFDPSRSKYSLDEHAFDQIVSRFEKSLQLKESTSQNFGLLVHDNNQTVAKKHTTLMHKFHQNGTLWTTIKNIIETPLFVDSQLTSMVQIADLCSYALRRYLENNEDILFNQIFKRADRRNETTVGVRHFSSLQCQCAICASHRKT